MGLADGLGLGEALGLDDGPVLADGLGDGDAEASAMGVPARGVLRAPGVAACALAVGATDGAALGAGFWLAAGEAVGDALGAGAGEAAALAFGAGEGGGATAGTAEGAADGATEGFGATLGTLGTALVGATAGFAGAVVAVGNAWVSTTGVAAVLVGSAATGSAVAAAIVSGAALACRVGINGLKIMARTANAMNTRESTIILRSPRLGTAPLPYRRCDTPALGHGTPARNPMRDIHMRCRCSGPHTIRHALTLLAVCSTNCPGGQVR